MKRFVFLLVVVSGCFGTVFPAANAQPAETSSAPVRAGEDTSPETIEFSADRMSGSTGDRSDYTRLSGNARIATDTLEITADVDVEMTTIVVASIFYNPKPWQSSLYSSLRCFPGREVRTWRLLLQATAGILLPDTG